MAVRQSALTSEVLVALIDGWGDPVAGESIDAFDANGAIVNGGVTDAAGQVSLSVEPGTYRFRLVYRGTYFWSAACEAPACAAATVQIMKPVQVAVTDGYGGVLADRDIIAIDSEGNQAAWGTTDSLGVATIYVGPGAYLFRVIAGNMYFDSGPSGSCEIPGCVSASMAVTSVRISVAGADGRPAVGVTVAAVDAEGVEINWPVTDEQGRADVFVPAGAYKFRVVANGDYFESGANGHCVVLGCRTASVSVPVCTGRPDGTICNDGAVCTQSETCRAGRCQASSQFPSVLNLPVDDLGTLGGTESLAAEINASGQVTGYSFTATGAYHVFLQSGTGPMSDVGGLPGFPALSNGSAINDAGTITGYLIAPDGYHAFTYSASGGLVDLGLGGDGLPAPDGGASFRGSRAYDINSAGQVAGFFSKEGTLRGFRYNVGSGFEDIGWLEGGNTIGRGISESGTIVGSSWVDGSPDTAVRRLGHAVRFDDEIIGLEDLNDIIDPTAGWTLITANAIADDYIVGIGDHGGKLTAFRLRLSTGVLDDLSGGWEGGTYAFNVNSAGDVLGWGSPTADDVGHAAFVYTDLLGFKKLNDVIDPASGWDLRSAIGINSSGEIVGWGQRGGQRRAFHLRLPQGQSAVCQARDVCGGGDGDAICLYSDGVVETSPGHFVAVFGFDNASTSSVQPTVNQVRLDGNLVANPQPAPPAYLPPGTHAGAYLPKFDSGQTIAWTVNGETVSASASSPRLPTVPIGSSGLGVVIGGETIVVKPDLGPYSTPPANEPTVQAEPPTGEPFNGALTGQLAVSPSGAATYTVPIAVPPGIAGMAPNLSLVYNSQAGDGIAGRGWDLAGLSLIHRCPKTKAQDGFGHQVTVNPLDFDEGVCLDGKRLFEQGGSPVTLTLEQNDHSTITKVFDDPGGPNNPGILVGVSFKVVTKTGETRYYGKSSRTRVVLPGQAHPVVWALERVMDSFGNYFDVHYNDDSTTNFGSDGLFVTSIDYTGHVPNSIGAGSAAPFAHVRFAYDPRRETRAAQLGTASVPRNKRLRSITSSVDVDGVETLAGTYTLTYANDYVPGTPYAADNDPMLPTRLLSIGYCSVDKPLPGVPIYRCMKPLEFDWDGGGYRWEAAPAFAPPMPIDRGGENREKNQGTQFVDVDGDGRLDFVFSKGNVSIGLLDSHAWRNTGQGWEPADQWALPAPLTFPSGDPTGATFSDIDGDGLPDLVAWLQECQGGQCSVPHPGVWLNRIRRAQGDAWEYHPEFATIPGQWDGDSLDFTGADRIADMNGDGRGDLVRFGPGDFQVQVRESTNSGWAIPTANFNIEPLLSEGGDASVRISKMKLEDVNRDGLPDMVWGLGGGLCGNHAMGINTGRNQGRPPQNDTVWRVSLDAFGCGGAGETPADKRTVGDLGGDGFRDMVSWYRTQLNEASEAGSCIGDITAPTCACSPGCFVETTCPAFQSDPSCTCTCPNHDVTITAEPKLTFATGSSWTTNGTSSFLTSLSAFRPHPNEQPIAAHWRNDFIFAMADLNADGLADFILNHEQGGGLAWGQALVNNGAAFDDLEGATGWSQSFPSAAGRLVPAVPTEDKDFPRRGRAFIDLDGDGVTDLVQAEHDSQGTLVRNAWLNRFRPPVIKKFPNGLARPSEVTYAVITTAGAQADGTYTDGQVAAPGTTFFMTPLRVVASVSSEDGTATGTMFTTTYQYFSLRASALGRGPQGFEHIRATDGRPASDAEPDARKVVDTSYAQHYPYTGMPTRVQRYILYPSGPSFLTVTRTDYCDTLAEDANGNPVCRNDAAYPAGTSLFVYPVKVTDVSYFYDGDVAAHATTNELARTTEYRYDVDGNPVTTKVTTEHRDGTCGAGDDCARHTKTITNFYAASGGASMADLRRLGKPTRTVVVSDGNVTTGDALAHATEFDYYIAGSVQPPGEQASPSIALRRKRVEPGAGPPIELHTSYRYDAFGNVVETLECPSQFEFCVAGTDPGSLPYRQTKASYLVADFTPPPGGRIAALAYGDGRFPVKATNALGHVEYSAYDPFVGFAVQKTGPNGTHTCMTYDGLGYQLSQTERCGSANELTTTMGRFLATTSDPPLAKVVNRTRAPTGVASWAYSDALGRATFARGRTFDGGFSESFTLYDRWGRTTIQSTPRSSASAESPFVTTTTYDEADRVRSVARDLGSIDGGALSRRAIQTFSYRGMTVRTEHNLDGEDEAHLHQQPREETKNVLGKVSFVDDASGSRIAYSYDADGNLTGTFDGQDSVDIVYDLRGRRTQIDDPDLGHWQYIYNGYGELESQTDANQKTVTMAYDKLGRMTSRLEEVESSREARWVYDQGSGGVGRLSAMVSEPDDRLQGTCAAPYGLPSGEKRAVRSFTYTQFGQLENAVDCTDGDTFVTSHAYDSFGRESVVTYPDITGTRLAVRYNYTSLGFLHYVSDATDNSLYWAATSRNAAGQVTSEYTRNGVDTFSTRNPATGWLMASQSLARAEGSTLIQNWSYQFDEVGNLRRRLRSDEVNGPPSDETFGYDPLNRLRSSTATVGTDQYSETYDIDARGNLLRKANKPYTYGAAGGCTTGGPHAVCTVDAGPQYQYDANGNMLSDSDRSASYNLANKVLHIQSGAAGVDFVYGADGQRVVQEATGGGATARTVYVGLGATGKSLYERTNRNGAVEHTHFLYAGDAHSGSAFAFKVVREAPAAATSSTLSFYHYDHLGSVTAVSDEQGHVVGAAWGGGSATAAGYDPWGARRSPDGRPADPAAFQPLAGHREFTGHEAIPGVGLVNMNGRVYDPVLGRFLSPDPNVQFVADLQSYNRYSYVLNNPLRYTDPTGYFTFGGDTAFGMFLGIAAGAACAVGTYGMCAVGYVMVVAYTVSTMSMAGASTEQILASSAISIAAGFVGGVAGGAVAAGLGGGVGAQVVGGAVAGMMSAAITSAAMNQSLGSGDLILAGISGAISAGIAAGYRSNPVSQEYAAEAYGGTAREVHAPSGGGDIVECGGSGAPACGKWNATTRSPAQLRRDVALAKGFFGREEDGSPNVRYRTHMQRVEYGFSLYTGGGNPEVKRTPIHTDGSPRYVNIPHPPPGTTLLTEAHSHPPGSPLNEFFSEGDVKGPPAPTVQQGLMTDSRRLLIFDPNVGAHGTITEVPWLVFTASPYFRHY